MEYSEGPSRERRMTLIAILTNFHVIVHCESPLHRWPQHAERQLQAVRQNLRRSGARQNNIAPLALGIVVLEYAGESALSSVAPALGAACVAGPVSPCTEEPFR